VSASRPALGGWSATALVVTSMVGTGAFTSLGFQVRDVGDPLAILGLWGLGGVLAACGAVCYAELAAATRINGGEYALLSRAWHPVVGFVAGVVGLFAGFAGPAAVSALAFGQYLAVAVPGTPPTLAAGTVLVASAALHGWDARVSARWQVALTAVELALIAGFVAVGAWGAVGLPARRPVGDVGGLAVSLLYITYAYSGWNAAAYVAGELRDPAREAPRALLGGTLVVTAIYLCLQAVFLASGDPARLAGEVEVGALAATAWLGPVGGRVTAALIAWCLASMVGATLVTGSRLLAAFADDVPAWAWFGRRGAGGAPARALWVLTVLGSALAATAALEDLLAWMGMLLACASTLAVLGVAALRWREPGLPRPFRVPLYPLPMLIFVAGSVATVGVATVARPGAAAAAAGIALAAALAGARWAAPRRRT
jgi:APA family basic amino acid/polyamine antiporter